MGVRNSTIENKHIDEESECILSYCSPIGPPWNPTQERNGSWIRSFTYERDVLKAGCTIHCGKPLYHASFGLTFPARDEDAEPEEGRSTSFLVIISAVKQHKPAGR